MQPQGPYGPPNQQFQPGQQGQQPPYPPQQNPYGPGAAIPGQQPYPGGQPYNGPQNQGQSHPQQPPVPQYQPPAGINKPTNDPTAPPPPPATPATPYDFFMKPNHITPGSTKNIKKNNNLSKKGRIAVVAGGLVALLAVVGIVSAMLPKDTSGEELINIARTQTELARVADQGSKAKTSGVKAFAMNSSLTINSDKARLLAYMEKNGFSYSSKTLNTGRNAKTDEKLKAAVTSSTYDDTFRLIWTSQMTAYTTLLKQRLVNTTGTNERQMLNEDIQHVELLLEQSKM